MNNFIKSVSVWLKKLEDWKNDTHADLCSIIRFRKVL